jgi:broad specificity phosphatase PhoE
MPRTLRYLTHTQIDRDPDVPIPTWRLSSVGRSRLTAMSWCEVLKNTQVIYASAQTRALETAGAVASSLLAPVYVRAEMREADRGSAGYVADASFGDIMRQFFDDPTTSVSGWESAAAAQQRIVSATEAALSQHQHGDLLLVGHGTVGALLYCHFAGLAISGEHRQSDQGGNVFAVDIDANSLVHAWQPLETLG